MTVLPIVERELRVSSRRRGTYLSRLGAAITSILGSAWILIGLAEELSSSQMGQALFVLLTLLSFVYCVGAGIRSTADCISGEKREGTLGLLFLTDLKGFDVVLGKLTANSLNTVYALFAIFPVLAIPILLGGISPGQFWRVVLTLTTTLGLSLSIGILLSTYGWEGRRSSVAGTVILLLLSLAPPACAIYFSATGAGTMPDAELMIPSPAFATTAAFDIYYFTWKTEFWLAVTLQGSLAVVLLTWASLAVPLKWQDRPATVRVQTWKDRWKQWKLGHSEERHRFRTRLLNINPIYWLSSRDRLKPAMIWGYLGLVHCVWIWAALRVGQDWFDPATYHITGAFLILSLKLWIAYEAASQFATERAAGSMELLLSTPLRTEEILEGQSLGLRRQFLWPGIVVLVDCFLMILIMHSMGERSTDLDSMFGVYGYIVTFPLDAIALGWTGLWLGLSSKRVRRAGGLAIFRVLGLPWLAFLLITIAISTAEALLVGLRNSNYADPNVGIWIWFAVGAANSVYWIFNSKSNLRLLMRDMSIPNSRQGQPGQTNNQNQTPPVLA